eukprot:3028491-Rhodomonas_salina.2
MPTCASFELRQLRNSKKQKRRSNTRDRGVLSRCIHDRLHPRTVELVLGALMHCEESQHRRIEADET